MQPYTTIREVSELKSILMFVYVCGLSAVFCLSHTTYLHPSWYRARHASPTNRARKVPTFCKHFVGLFMRQGKHPIQTTLVPVRGCNHAHGLHLLGCNDCCEEGRASVRGNHITSRRTSTSIGGTEPSALEIKFQAGGSTAVKDVQCGD